MWHLTYLNLKNMKNFIRKLQSVTFFFKYASSKNKRIVPFQLNDKKNIITKTWKTLMEISSCMTSTVNTSFK